MSEPLFNVEKDTGLNLLTEALKGVLPEDKDKKPVLSAMRYALLSEGKRIRPLLLLATYKRLGGEVRNALPLALALEMIHTASLVFDDLPSMDDAKVRRGKPTLHVAYSEGTAILAGIGLITLAYQTILDAHFFTAEARLTLLKKLTSAIGTEGLVGGQDLDLKGSQTRKNIEAISKLNHRKTGVLFVSAFEFAAIAVKANSQVSDSLIEAGTHLGQAYQLHDDLQDTLSDDGVTGKTRGRDSNEKTSLFLLNKTQGAALIRTHRDAAGQALRRSGVPLLLDLPDFLLSICYPS